MFEIWYFHGDGDPMFGGNADDQVLYRKGHDYRFYRYASEAKRDGYTLALFSNEKCGLQIGHALAPKGALVSSIVTLRAQEAA